MIGREEIGKKGGVFFLVRMGCVHEFSGNRGTSLGKRAPICRHGRGNKILWKVPWTVFSLLKMAGATWSSELLTSGTGSLCLSWNWCRQCHVTGKNDLDGTDRSVPEFYAFLSHVAIPVWRPFPRSPKCKVRAIRKFWRVQRGFYVRKNRLCRWKGLFLVICQHQR